MTTIKLRRDTSINWTTVNPILAEGEVGIDTNNNYIKIGDGSTAWNNLPYATITPEILQVALGDKVDYFEVDSPLTEKWQVNSNAELEANASVSDSGILTDTTSADYWALNNTTIGNYIDNQMSYWHIHFRFKTSTNNEVQPLFGLADGVGEYDTNFIELYVTSGYLRTLNETTSVSIPTNTWVEVDIEHLEGASTASAKVNVNGTIYTVSNVIKSGYTLSSAKGVEWLGLGVTPFEFDITWDGFYVQNAPYSAKYCLLTDRHIGVDDEAFDGQWVKANSGNIISGSNITWASGHNYDLSSYLPNDGHVYEVIFTASWNGSTAGSNHELRASTDIITSAWNWLGRVSGQNPASGTCILPVGSGRYVKLTTGASACNAVYLSALGYRRLGTNS